jgi:hypothetical protein
MKKGENVIYFSFRHTSIEVDTFIQSCIKLEDNPEAIKGQLAVIDSSQIPQGKQWNNFIEEKTLEIKSMCEVNFVFMDVVGMVNTDSKVVDSEYVINFANHLSFIATLTSVVVCTIDVPPVQIQDVQQAKEVFDRYMEAQITLEDCKLSSKSVRDSDFILSISREKKSFWKKIINFLLFWRKKSNFTVRILKNSNNSNKNYRSNIDIEKSSIEIL